jgi:hypothetical protein
MNINHGVRNSIYRQSEAVDEAAWQYGEAAAQVAAEASTAARQSKKARSSSSN